MGSYFGAISGIILYLPLRKCKNNFQILQIILVPDFCPLTPEIARFSIGFGVNLLYYRLCQRSGDFYRNVWFQKISISLPRRDLEIPRGWGVGVKYLGNSGGG